jgi:predicted ArsR family transcriptional regulator
MVHVFKALQLMKDRGHASRDLLCQELGLGEGTIKTLLKHLKMHDIIKSTNAGTKLTD